MAVHMTTRCNPLESGTNKAGRLSTKTWRVLTVTTTFHCAIAWDNDAMEIFFEESFPRDTVSSERPPEYEKKIDRLFSVIHAGKAGPPGGGGGRYPAFYYQSD